MKYVKLELVNNTAQQESPNSLSQSKSAVIEIPQFGMWVGFLYIIYFISLYLWATSFGNILHEIVNRYVPDALEIEETRRSLWGLYQKDLIIMWSLAALAIFYPVFALAHLLIHRLILTRPEVINIRVRKILIYITLIGTFLLSCFQFVKFMYTFLNGSISTRTVAHFLITLTISSLIFAFYILQVRKDKS